MNTPAKRAKIYHFAGTVLFAIAGTASVFPSVEVERVIVALVGSVILTLSAIFERLGEPGPKFGSSVLATGAMSVNELRRMRDREGR